MSLSSLMEAWGILELGEFKPGLFYYPAIDWLLYLSEDCAYRAGTLVPGVVDILWHPHEDRIVGLKIWHVSDYPDGAMVIKSLTKPA